MKLYETVLTERAAATIRVRAESREQAKEIFEEFMDVEPEYLSEELDLNGSKEWLWGPFDEVHPSYYDEKATITKNEDGTFDACYEGGEEE